MKNVAQQIRGGLPGISAGVMMLFALMVAVVPRQSQATYRISSVVVMPPSAPLVVGKQVFQRVIANDTEWAYLVYLPPTYDSTSAKRWPLLYYLAPAGGMYYDGWSGQSLSSLYDSARTGLNGGPAYFLNSPSKCTYISDRFIVVSPYMGYVMLNSGNGTPPRIMGLFKYLKSRLKVDTTCTTMMGFCAGGGVGYSVAAAYPTFFSGMVTMSTGDPSGSPCDLTKACALKNLAYRIYGDKRDTYCPAGATQGIYDAVHNCPGTKVTLTWTDIGQHEIWGAAGLDTVKSMYDWMIANGGTTSIAPRTADNAKASLSTIGQSRDSRIELFSLDGRVLSRSMVSASATRQALPGLSSDVHVVRITRGSHSVVQALAPNQQQD